MRTLLLHTPHGSRLYGLAHAGSDYDTFSVFGWRKFKPSQSLNGDADDTVTSYDTFMRYADKGTPQYLEAMYSRLATTDNMPFNRSLYQPNMRLARDSYRRTMTAFWMQGCEEDSYKKRRHALRLLLNLQSLERFGSFNPTLNDSERWFTGHFAEYTDRETLKRLS